LYDIVDALRSMELRTTNKRYEFGGNDSYIHQTRVVNLEIRKISFEDLGTLFTNGYHLIPE